MAHGLKPIDQHRPLLFGSTGHNTYGIGDSDERNTFCGTTTDIVRITVRPIRSCAIGALRPCIAASGDRHPDGPKRMRCTPSGTRADRLGHARDGEDVLRSLARSVAGSVRGRPTADMTKRRLPMVEHADTLSLKGLR